MLGHFIAPLFLLFFHVFLLYSILYKKVTSWAAKFVKFEFSPDKFMSYV